MIILGLAYSFLLVPLERGMQELRGYSALPFRTSRIALNTATLITGFFFAYLFILLPYDIILKLVVAVGMFFLLFLQSLLWWTKRQGFFSLYFSLIISVIVVETLWVLQFLPHTPFVVTLIFLSLLHLLIGLVHNYSKGQLTLRLVGEYFSITLLLCFLLLATSQWFPLYTQ
jgi:hypothetical protein